MSNDESDNWKQETEESIKELLTSFFFDDNLLIKFLNLFTDGNIEQIEANLNEINDGDNISDQY
ncbi:MAG TPA: hypothetical protein VHA74_03255 [Candidatus Dojkabacteria bacterium]|nr:hypothetical protein [Candidatus Dojkabacteria bacterium]